MKPEQIDVERTYVVDRAGWPPGPWDAEPDKLQWKTEAGLPGLIVRNYMGVLCGYAAVNPGHPLYGRDFVSAGRMLDAWFGVNYSDRCQENGPICHLPEPGEPADVWWFGFDCGHAGVDMIPRLITALERIGRGDSLDAQGTYRDMVWVKAQVEDLAAQLATIQWATHLQIR